MDDINIENINIENIVIEDTKEILVEPIPQIQNIVVDKKTNLVKSISQWSDGRKIDPNTIEDDDMLLYIEDPNKFLNMSTRYKYLGDISFEKVIVPNVEENVVNLKELQLQIKELQQSNAELMNLIATQSIAPIK